jgi:hypothetical protein
MTIQRRPAAAIAGVLLGVLVFAAGGGAASAGSAAFTDPGGDANGAPDIASVSLSDVPGTGEITATVTAAGLVPSTSVDVWLDTDKNSSTGSSSGCEYLFEVWQEADPRSRTPSR